MREPNGRTAAAMYIERNKETQVTREHVVARLLAGSSFEFERAVSRRVRGTTGPNTKSSAGVAVEAAVVLINEVHHAGTEWHVWRGIEQMHHVDWCWRKACEFAAGPGA